MKKTLNLTGKSGKTYDLDKINTDKRTDTSKLVVHVHRYKNGESPNPETPEVGEIWLSIRDNG